MIRKILITCANFLYVFFKILPVKNRVTMISRQSDEETVDFRLLREKFNKENPDLQVCVLCHKLEGGIKANFWDKIRYIIHCVKQMYYIATSKVVILDSYCILISVLKHRKSLKVIQMWHSMGTMKKFGYQILGKEEGSNEKIAKDMRMHKNYDYIFASGKAYAKLLADGFGYEVSKVKIYPLPRVDLLTSDEYKNEVRSRIAKAYPEINQKKNIVYCPTFRKNEDAMQKKLEKLMSSIDYEKYNLIIKLHPLSKMNIENKKAIIDKQFSSFDMLFIADYLISDYSCIIYEASVLKIPLYFWAFDLQKYLNNRGLNLDYEKELPGLVSKDIGKIVKSIEKDKYNIKELEEFQQKYIEKTVNCTSDIVKFVVGLIRNEGK